MKIRIKHLPSYGVGYSDGTIVRAINNTPCYYVTFPDGYSSYYAVVNCLVLDTNDDKSLVEVYDSLTYTNKRTK